MNILSHSCGYGHSGDMVIQNADYLINAIGIRLNTFDLSPAGAIGSCNDDKSCWPVIIAVPRRPY